MKQLFFIGLMLLSGISVYGQEQNVDSLVNVLETQKLTSEEQLTLYGKICQQYMQNDQEKFKTYTDKGLELANQEKDKKRMANFNGLLGIFYSYKSSHDTAFIYYEKALELAQEIENKNLEAMFLTNIALVYSAKGDFATEIEYDLKALTIYEQIDDKKPFITLLVNIGTTYRSLKDIDRALNYFDRANKYAEETNYVHGKLLVAYAYGSLYWDKKEYDKCIEYYLKSLELSKAQNNIHFEILSLQSVSTFYADETCPLRDLKKAEEYANESLLIANEFGDPFRIRGSLRVLAAICLYQKRYNDCVDLATQAWKIDSIDIDTSHDLASFLTVSNIHLGNKEQAERYFNEYTFLNGEKNKQNLQETLIDMEVKYETEKKELRITSLEKERQLYIWLGLAGILLALALVIAFRQKTKRAQKEKQLIAADSVQDGEMMERERLARDLHDRLGGNLSALKIELKNSRESMENIYDKLDSCIEEIRRVSHDLMPVSLQRGMKAALEDFAAQFPQVHFHFFGEEKRIEKRKEYVIYCCASELVNNSLKHSGAQNINLQLVQNEKYITLTVQDDGCGFDEQTVTQGIGLKNIHDRITSCNGKIDIATSPGKGTETTIEIIIN
jgi:signal transduction histidine kinase